MGRWIRVSPSTRNFEAIIRPAVWEMVQATYAPIGLIVNSPAELDEYDVWEVYVDGDDVVAFRLGKTTPYGTKGGLLGSNGSEAGKTAVKRYIAEWFQEPGNYSEVSHRVLELALRAGAPVVCAIYVPAILRKPVEIEGDGVHYRRFIKNVGPVSKVMVGRPLDTPVTSAQQLQCPLPESATLQGSKAPRVDASREALFDHAASLIDL